MTIPYDDRWFELVRDDLSTYEVPRVALETMAHWSWFNLDGLAFGYRLGLLRGSDAVGISLRRLEASQPQSDAQQKIALALPDEFDEVERTLGTRNLTSTSLEAEKLWLYCALTLYGERWRSANRSGIEYELAEILAHWTDAAAEPWWQTTRRPPRFGRSRDASPRQTLKNFTLRLAHMKSIYLAPAGRG